MDRIAAEIPEGMTVREVSKLDLAKAFLRERAANHPEWTVKRVDFDPAPRVPRPCWHAMDGLCEDPRCLSRCKLAPTRVELARVTAPDPAERLGFGATPDRHDEHGVVIWPDVGPASDVR